MKTAILYLIINAILWGGYPDNGNAKMSQYVMTVTVTAYSPSVDETDSTPYTTASNKRVRDGICALSQDIEKQFDLQWGDMIYLEGIGTCEFQDRMNKRMRKTVDLFFWWKRAAKRFGVIEGVRMGFEKRR